MDLDFNSAADIKAIDDKNLYDFYFHDVRRAKSIIRKISDRYLDVGYQMISLEAVVEQCLTQNELVIKKALNSNSGKGVVFLSKEDGIDALKTILKSPYDFVVQESIKQHPAIGLLHESSINTLRIVTLYYKGEIHVLSSVVRMGVGGSRV